MSTDAWNVGLTTARFGRRLIAAARVDSTNARAIDALAGAPLPEGTTFVADRQTKGRGTGGRRWESDDADGLWLSLVLRAPLRKMPVSFLPGIALVDLLRQDYGLDAHVKWPNDVLVGDAKISGALIESARLPDGETAWVLGIGVNINQSRLPECIADIAVSMRMLSGHRHDRGALFRGLMARLEKLYDGGADLVAEWRERTRMLGRRARVVRAGTAEAEVTVLDLSPEGYLQVGFDDGRREQWVASSDLQLRSC